MKHLGGWLVRARLKFFGRPKRKKPRKNLQKSLKTSRNLCPRLQGKGKKHVSKQTKEEKGAPDGFSALKMIKHSSLGCNHP